MINGLIVLCVLSILGLIMYSFFKAIDASIKLSFERYKSETFQSLYLKGIREDIDGIHICGIIKGLLALGQVVLFVFGGVFFIPVFAIREIYKNTVREIRKNRK